MMVKPKDVMKAISGTWLYLNVTSYFDNGTIADSDSPSLGQFPTGILTYSQEGYMSANFMSARQDDRPEDIDIDTEEPIGTDAEWALIGKHTLAYAGPWYVSETTENVEVGQITHGPTKVAWLPTWVGKELQKNYTLSDDKNTMRLRTKNKRGVNKDMLFTRLA